MSTSFLTESELLRWANQLGLMVKLVSSDPHAHDAEFRVTRGSESGENLFQGTMDRCSDFIKGYLQGSR